MTVAVSMLSGSFPVNPMDVCESGSISVSMLFSQGVVLGHYGVKLTVGVICRTSSVVYIWHDIGVIVITLIPTRLVYTWRRHLVISIHATNKAS